LSLHWLVGRTLTELGSPSEPLTSLRRSIAIAEDLARRELYARAKRSLSVLYWAIIGPLAGQDMLNVGDSKQSAEVYADKALRIAETLAAGDSSNDQARADLVFAYAGMGEALQSTQPAKAGLWYLKSIALAGRMADRDAARNYVAQLDQSLAAVLVRPEQIRERLRRLQEANTIRQELTRTDRSGPHVPMFLMRSYCDLSDAESAAGHLAQTRQIANSALPLLREFNLTSPSLGGSLTRASTNATSGAQ
jgi:eukaryotic-like serine/threonine-protein kinase